MTILEIITTSTEYLTKKSHESPRLMAELLLCEILGQSRLSLYTKFDKPVKSEEIDKMREFIIRAGKNEPLQYITGTSNFLGLDIKCDSRGLIPRHETEHLAKIAEQSITNGDSILEIGTGSGCISVYLALKFPDSEITAIDISDDAIALAKENAELHNAGNINFFKADILKVLPQKNYKILISNPPYIPSKEINELEKNVKDFEPLNALDGGDEGVTFYTRYVSLIQKSLVQKGKFFFEFGYGQENKMKEIFSDFKFKIENDINGYPRFIIGEK